MNTYMKEYSAKQIANALGKASQSRNGWDCCCPAHHDERSSLSITESNDGKILMCCHASCSQEAVIDELKERAVSNDSDSQILKDESFQDPATYDRYVTEDVACHILGMSKPWLRRMRWSGQYPELEYVKYASAVRYRLSSLYKFADSHTIFSTSQKTITKKLDQLIDSKNKDLSSGPMAQRSK